MVRLFLALNLIVWTLPAQKFIEWWEGTYEAAFEEARRRNVPVLVAFNRDHEEANERVVQGLYKNAEFIALMQRCIPMIACLVEPSHPPMKMNVRGHVRSCCSRFGFITCRQHRAIDMKARPVFWKDEVRTPSHVVVLPDGKEVDRLIDVHGVGAFENLLAKAQKRLGRGLSANVYRRIGKEMRAVRKAIAAESYAEAIERLDALQKEVKGHPLEAELKKLQAAVDEAGRGLLETADRLAARKSTLDALRLLRRGAADFKGSRVGSRLKQAAAKLVRTKEGRKAARELRREERARPDLEAALQAERRGDFVRAAQLFERVIERAAGTPLEKEAADRLQRLEKDEDIGRLIRKARAEKAATDLYRKGLRLLRRGDASGGRKLLEEVIERYPDTKAADKARAKLKEGS